MFYLYLADAVVIVHFAFVIFVVAGGLLMLRWPQLVWLHLPALAWGAWVEFAHWICPLTYLEDWLRGLSGSGVYRGDFVEHYLLPILYPARLTAGVQVLLGVLVLAINAAAYTGLWRSGAFRRKRQHLGE